MYFFCAVFKDEKSDSTQQDAIGKRQTFEQSRPRSCFYLHFFASCCACAVCVYELVDLLPFPHNPKT